MNKHALLSQFTLDPVGFTPNPIVQPSITNMIRRIHLNLLILNFYRHTLTTVTFSHTVVHCTQPENFTAIVYPTATLNTKQVLYFIITPYLLIDFFKILCSVPFYCYAYKKQK